MMLRTEHVLPYKEVEHFQNENGFIVWRLGTGGNVEIVNIKVKDHRKGTGKTLLKTMLKRLIDHPPRTSIFGFTWIANKEAQAFYRAMGFQMTRVKGLYDDGAAIFFSANYAELKQKHLGAT